MKYNNLPLIVIVGPTASGKSAIAVELAEKYNGEIICADSRTIFRDMNIGTAKPDSSDITRVPHWGLDLVSPGEYFSAADFKQYAVEKINQIRERGHVPFLVGGTGLYVDSVVFDFKFSAKADTKLRDKLSTMSLQELQEHCNNSNIKLPENNKNIRHLVRAIETNGVINRDNDCIIENTIIVGITTEKEVLLNRILQRINQMIAAGVIDETQYLIEKYGRNIEAMKSNIYPLISEYIDGLIPLETLLSKAKVADWHLAKRQITWLKRNKFIQWFKADDARQFIDSYLATIE